MSKVFIEDEHNNIIANANEDPFVIDQVGTDCFVNGVRQDRLDFSADPQDQINTRLSGHSTFIEHYGGGGQYETYPLDVLASKVIGFADCAFKGTVEDNNITFGDVFHNLDKDKILIRIIKCFNKISLVYLDQTTNTTSVETFNQDRGLQNISLKIKSGEGMIVEFF